MAGTAIERQETEGDAQEEAERDAQDNAKRQRKLEHRSKSLAARDVSLEQRETQNDGDDDNDDDELGIESVLEFVNTDKGYKLANRLIDLFEGIRRATLDEGAKARAERSKLAMHAISRNWWLKVIGLITVITAIVVLSSVDKLTSAAATILGALAGYLFGQSGKGQGS